VDFVGPMDRPGVRTLLRSSRVFAHAALEESFGILVLEAMVSGVPVVGGSRGGAAPWLLEDGAGLIVDVRRPETLADGICRLVDDRSFAAATATAERAYQRARTQFSIGTVAARYLEELTALAGGSR
jgi:L-malate glycosyltransferase